ncbi:hypothetical protein VEE27_15440 [Escherichia coli]|nr:hypothetical protein VEE27_15440 [Escherichia coli]BEB76209.1 hypothetical protein VEE22_15270 [Escherichia coli]
MCHWWTGNKVACVGQDILTVFLLPEVQPELRPHVMWTGVTQVNGFRVFIFFKKQVNGRDLKTGSE